MDFIFSEEQKSIFNLIRDFSKKKLNDRVFEDDEESIFPTEKWKACGDLGIFGLPIPEEYGGQGMDMLTTALAIKALGYGCKDEGLVVSICAHLCTFVIPLHLFGTDSQKNKYLPEVCAGKLIGGNGISEADAGSDITLIKTMVEKKNDQYIINGSKIFVTNGPVADLLIIYAKHPGGMKMADTSAFLVEKGNFCTGQHFKKMGLRTSQLCEILLVDCAVSKENLIGRERLGVNVFNVSMLWERIITSAYNIGAMEQQYEIVLEYANQRAQFGSKLIKFQTMADKLVEMRLKIELSNLLLYQTCWKFDNGKIDMSDASMLKLYVSESRVKNSLDAVHFFGAYGYLKDNIVEKQLRDAISCTTYSGTSEMQRKIIAERLGKIYEV